MRFFDSLLLVFGLVLLSPALSAQDLGIQFYPGTLEQAMAQAKADNKCVFLDAYTTWCVPCQRMDRRVFTDPEVGQYYNQNYISVKMDMDRPDAKQLIQDYGIKYFPTFIYFTSDGEAVHKVSGECDGFTLVQYGEEALDTNKQYFTLLEAHRAGTASEEQLHNLARSMINSGHFQYEEMTAISNAYLATQSDLTSPKNMDYIMLTAYEQESTAFQSMVKNKDLYLEVYGDNRFIEKLRNVTQYSINVAAALKDEQMMNDVLNFNRENISTFAGFINSRLKASYYEQTEEWDKYAPAAGAFLETYGKRDPDIINQVAWNFYEKVDDSDQLTKALNWIERAIGMREDPFFLDTKAALLFKLGEKDKALKVCQESIKLAEKWGDEPKLTMELMRKMGQ